MTMADVLYRGDVLLMKNGDIGVIRNMHQTKKYNTCIVEMKGKPNETNGKMQSKNTKNNTTMKIKLHKKTQKPKNKKHNFKRLSSEQLFDKLSAVHEIINEDHIHQNKLSQLQRKYDILKQNLQQKELEIYDLKDKVKTCKKYLLLQQSIYTITHPKNIDKTSTPVLLLTYPTFTNCIQLFENLSNRFFNLNRDE
eukprot:123837_1